MLFLAGQRMDSCNVYTQFIWYPKVPLVCTVPFLLKGKIIMLKRRRSSAITQCWLASRRQRYGTATWSWCARSRSRTRSSRRPSARPRAALQVSGSLLLDNELSIHLMPSEAIRHGPTRNFKISTKGECDQVILCFAVGGEDMWVHLHNFATGEEVDCNKGAP